jgi:flagellar basal-body rod modification protein FlgD
MQVGDPQSTTTAANSTSQSNTTTINSDFDTFLKMLTVQMQNQDPLNPIESSDYATQLATFSGVEQQVKTNDLLTNLAAQFGAAGLTQVAGWVGQEARAVAPAKFMGQPIEIVPEIVDGAKSAVLIVKDTEGNVVQNTVIDTSGDAFLWNGTNEDGSSLPQGEAYTFLVKSMNGDEDLGTTGAAVYQTIVEVRSQDGAATLVLGSGAEVSASDITALRDPDLLQ